jgi:hypothetical protein
MAELCLMAALLLIWMLANEYAFWNTYGKFWNWGNGIRSVRSMLCSSWVDRTLGPVVEEIVFTAPLFYVFLGTDWRILWSVAFVLVVIFTILHGQYVVLAQLLLLVHRAAVIAFAIVAAQRSNPVFAFLLITVLHAVKNNLNTLRIRMESRRRRKTRLK